MISYWFVFVAMAVRLLSGARYIFEIFQKGVKPNPITWFCWTLTSMVAAFAQWKAGVGIQALMTFTLGVGPLAVFVISILKDRDATHFTKSNIACGLLAIVGIVLWQITSDPVLAIVFCILADIFGAIPTIVKARKVPGSEPALPYFLTMVSMVITLLTIKTWTIADAAFPIYIFCINAVIFSFARHNPGQCKIRE
ncbi:MAG TPA: hypothetical protein VMR45_04415 [Patescibacteria group bacterium]|nr:hypothetical protein [Patescibacteria group bacterium]